MRQFNLTCGLCSHSWLSSTQIVIACPKCQSRRIYIERAKIGAFRLGCRECNIHWYDQRREAPCIRCGQKNTNVKTIWIKNSETFNLPLRVIINPDLVVVNGNALGLSLFRLGCRNCNLYWLDSYREAPCPHCNSLSSSSKPQSVTEEQIEQIGIRVPRQFRQLNQLLLGTFSTCVNCGQLVDLEQQKFCANCGTPVEVFSPPQTIQVEPVPEVITKEPETEVVAKVPVAEGAPAEEVTEEEVPTFPAYCFNCGSQLTSASHFCASCGTPQISKEA
ncbi:MAG: hypothetical protein ACFFDI_17075 [Promethearchaeota archaeon]